MHVSPVTECGETHLNVTLSLLSFSCVSPRFLSSKIVSVAHKTAEIVRSLEPQICATEMKERMSHKHLYI